MKDAETLHMDIIENLATLQKNQAALTAISNLFGVDDTRLSVDLFGKTFKNPLGIAAGFDKFGRGVSALYAFGYAFVEVGTVTPRPQAGNPQPRMFRLPEDNAIINRFGFNNDGKDALKATLAQYQKRSGVLGINLGINKENTDLSNAIEDYVALTTLFHTSGDYLTINVSSPNTPELRKLQEKSSLSAIISAAMNARRKSKSHIPMLLKIAPDLSHREIADIVEVVISNKLDGIIATNTMSARPTSLLSANKTEVGGLSGDPLKDKSTDIIRFIYKETGGKLPIIGAGGIATAQDVIDKMRAGASLVQIYTSIEYKGLGLARQINLDLITYMNTHKTKKILDIIGRAK